MSLHSHIAAVTNLAQTAANEDEALHKKHGLTMGLTLGDPASEAYVAEAQSLDKALVSYLENLDGNTLRKLVTLAYAGRETNELRETGSLSAFHEGLEAAGVHDRGAAGNVDTLRGMSMNLPTYFRSALLTAHEIGVDIEGDLGNIG